LRVIAGTYRRRTLEAPPGMATRPTSDRLRETLFNVLAPRMQGAAFLDLYAGSGAVGIEASSRGAAQVVFVERGPAALKVLRANLARLGISTAIEVHASSVPVFLRKRKILDMSFDVVFLDPPYEEEDEYEATLGLLGGAASDALTARGVVIAEHRRKCRLDENFGALKRTRLLEQGDAALSFYEAAVS
jgi:16S rRNA (guanine966-N2)-methyltransferase